MAVVAVMKRLRRGDDLEDGPWLSPTGRNLAEAEFFRDLSPGSVVAVEWEKEPVWQERLIVYPAGPAHHFHVYTPDKELVIADFSCVGAGAPKRICRCTDMGDAPKGLRGKFHRFKTWPDDDEVVKLVATAYGKNASSGATPLHPPLFVNQEGNRMRLEAPATPREVKGPKRRDGTGGGTSSPAGLGAASSGGGAAAAGSAGIPAGEWVSLEERGGYKVNSLVRLVAADICLNDRGMHTLTNGEILAVARKGTFTPPVAPVATDAGSDARVLAPVVYDSRNNRWQELAPALARMVEEPMPDFPLAGERSALWLLGYVRDHGSCFDGRQSKWATEQSIGKNTLAYMIHDMLGLSLDMAVIARLYQLVEESHGSMTIEGWEHYVGRDLTGGLKRGIALAPALAKHAVDRQSQETEILKQRRKAREETAAATVRNNNRAPAGAAKE